MNEFVTVSSSSYDPAGLASQLTEKSADGWTVVAIVPTGGDVTAFLTRESSGASNTASADSTSMTNSAAAEPAVEHAPATATEPDGWAVAPAAEPATPYTPAPSSAPATVIQSSMSPIGDSYAPAPSYQPQPAPSSTPAVPAGWYADPAGRYELRYWDGTTWTEHVSRAGQQFTDAPVA
jgi:hypothetical protein